MLSDLPTSQTDDRNQTLNCREERREYEEVMRRAFIVRR